jgi:hypothetical protein
MLRRFQLHFDIFTDISRRVMEIPPTLEPDAGFSALAALSWADPGEAAVVELAQRLSSEYGVGVNPAYIFSGRREDWHRLYPGVTHLRVNVSDDEKALIGTTQRVCAGIEAITRSDPRWRPAT